MTLNARQTKVVDGAKDLLRRLKNERQRKVRPPNPEATVARALGSKGPKVVRELLTVIDQLDKAGEDLEMES